MRYRLLGRSGLRVSELCLGTMTFGEDWGWGASKTESRAIFDTFAEAGGNFIDTACNYTNGTSEAFVGDFIGADRDYWTVATKYTLRRPGSAISDLNGGGNFRKNMVRTVEGSLQRLNTDYIDLLYLHMWDYSTPVDEVLRAFDDLVQAGKVLYVGISDTPAWIVSYAQAMAELRGWSRFVAYQAQYSLISRGVERDVLPMAETLNVAVLAFSLIAGGVLSGKFNRPGGPDEATRVSEVSAENLAAGAAVVEMAEAVGRTPSQVAINWVRQQSPAIIPILGARRLEQMQENLGVLEFELTPEQVETLSAVRPLVHDYPHTYWNDYIRRDLIYGERVDQFQRDTWPRRRQY